MVNNKDKRNEVFIVSIKNHLLDEFSLAFIKNKVKTVVYTIQMALIIIFKGCVIRIITENKRSIVFAIPFSDNGKHGITSVLLSQKYYIKYGFITQPEHKKQVDVTEIRYIHPI